jgi:hypothetical protein
MSTTYLLLCYKINLFSLIKINKKTNFIIKNTLRTTQYPTININNEPAIIL